MIEVDALRVGVNLMWLIPGVVGGSEEYTVRLLRALSDARPAALSVRVYGRPELAEVYPDLVDRFAFVVAPSPDSRGVRIAAEATWLAAVTQRDDFVHHAGGAVPLVRTSPPVLTIHDLQPLDLAVNFSQAKRRWLQRMLPYSARAARVIICPSNFTAERLVAQCGTPRSKIQVVPHGFDSGEVDAPPTAPKRSGLIGGRYLLYPAIAYAHKRHIDAVRALHHLEGHENDVNLVFTGGLGPESGRVRDEIARLGLTDRVKVLGRVPVDELHGLYRGAVAVVFPSIYEGFGNPCLEAMSFGCPVIAASAGSLPEVVGDAGLLVAPESPEAIADAVRRVLGERGLRDRMQARGRSQAASFTTDRAATALLAAYRMAVPVGLAARSTRGEDHGEHHAPTQGP